MDEKIILDHLKRITGSREVSRTEVVQTLWSGYGEIVRYATGSGTVVIKHVEFSKIKNHPRGWNTSLSHQRKLRSYEVEIDWYSNWSNKCNLHCRIPECINVLKHNEDILIVLEDLDASGFHVRKNKADLTDMKACIKWLAEFHALFINDKPEGLWPIGTYWHLDTRPDELAALDDIEFKRAASVIDAKLNAAKYKTIVHGDAKLANFCFSNDGSVAAVDFQYTGAGCGIKDLTYFIGSCLHGEDCEEYENFLKDYYFDCLRPRIKNPEVDAHELEVEWRELFPYAWVDFHRFLKGWSPGHWKINTYSERITAQIIRSLR